MYGVVVVSGDEINNTPRDIITGNNDQLPPPYPGRNGVYTAAVWNNIEDVPLTFVVGGGEITVGPDGTEYVNRRLSERTSYGVFHYARLQSETERVVKICVVLRKGYESCTKIDQKSVSQCLLGTLVVLVKQAHKCLQCNPTTNFFFFSRIYSPQFQ